MPRGPNFRRDIPGTREALALPVPEVMLIRMGGRTGSALHAKLRDSLICPLDADPCAFTWPAAGRYCIVLNVTESIVSHAERLIQELLAQGATRVSVLLPDERIQHRLGHAEASRLFMES